MLTAQLPGQVGAQTVSEEPRLITVSGAAEVRVVPDEVLITLGVETWDEDLDRAKRDNDRRVQQIVALAKSYGVSEQHIQTDHISIEPRYRNDYENRDFIGYFVRKTIVITLRDLSRFEDLLAGVLQAGVTHVHGIQFRTTELRKYRDEARALSPSGPREKRRLPWLASWARKSDNRARFARIKPVGGPGITPGGARVGAVG